MPEPAELPPYRLDAAAHFFAATDDFALLPLSDIIESKSTQMEDVQ
jgi:hypothetical protein